MVISVVFKEPILNAIKDKNLSDEFLEKDAKAIVQEDLDRISEGKQPKTFSKKFFLSDQYGCPFFSEKPIGKIIIKGKVHSIRERILRTTDGKLAKGRSSMPKSFVIKCILSINTVNGIEEKMVFYWISRLKGQWVPFLCIISTVV